jgi:class 3 adenylate cyclase/tetratricopeptide (TPR) repeat protein
MDPEEVSILMNRLLQYLAGAVYDYEGYVDKFIGDAIMALFGAPLAHENDPERATLAGLAMLDVVARHNQAQGTDLEIRVGINVGEVVAVHLGTGGRMQYTVLGDAVNVASRLEGEAAPSTVLVSEAVYRRVDHRFEAEELEPLELKGKAEKVRAFRVVGVREAVVRRPTGETPFVGRETELAEIDAFLRDVAQGRSGSVLIEAEAGGGKTRLVEEAMAREGSGFRRVLLRFSSVRLPGQRSPASEIFHQLFPADEGDPVTRALEALGPEAERHRVGLEGLAPLADSGGVRPHAAEGDPAAARQNRWVALAALLRALARERPLVLWIEDAHWLDETSDEFLTFLLPSLADAQVGVLLTGRPELTGDWIPADVRRVPLRPLDEEAARALLGDLADDLGIERRRDLIRRSQGNPLFLEELARSLHEGSAGGTLPGTVQGIIKTRIDRLGPAPKTLLEMASILGTRFPAPLLRRMYRLEALALGFDDALAALQSAAFVMPESSDDEAWNFRHALTQEVAYGGLLVRVRNVLHESAARLGEEHFADRREAEAPFFAHHYWLAGLKREATPHLWIAGRDAARGYDLPAAERYLDRAAEAFREEAADLLVGEEKARYLETYGNVLLHRGRMDDADEQFGWLESNGEKEGRGEWSARGLEYRGRVAWYRGDLGAAEDLFERGLARLPSGYNRIEADLHNDLGIVYYYRGRPEDAFAHHTRAIELRRALHDKQGMAKSFINIGNLMIDFRDDVKGAEKHYQKAYEMAGEALDRQVQYSALFNLGTIMQDRGEYARSIETFVQGERLLEEIGWWHARYLNLMRQAASEIPLGLIDAALHHLGACLERGDRVLEPVNRVNTRVLLFDAYLSAFADERAAAMLEDACRLVDDHEIEESREATLLREGRWLCARGDWETAAGAFEQAVRQARRYNHASFAALAEAHRCRALTRAGDHGVGPCEIEAAGQLPILLAVDWLNADAEAERSPGPDAAEALGRVADRATEIGDPGLERAAAERQAEVFGLLGNQPGAAVALERALRAITILERHLPSDLRGSFAAHPRNVALRDAALAARG